MIRTLHRAPLLAALVLAAAPALAASEIGLQVQPMTPALREFFDAPEDRGVLVSGVRAGGPAAAAGVAVGDVIVSVAGEPVREPADLRRVVEASPAGEPLALEVVRDGDRRALEVEPEVVAEPAPSGDRWERWQQLWEELAPHARREFERRIDQLEERLRELERELERRHEQKLAPGHEST